MPDGFSKAKATARASASRAKPTTTSRATASIAAAANFSKAKATGEGFQGQGHRRGLSRRTDDDVEGHSMSINPLVARELAHARERDVQANVKRHNFENDARAAKKGR